MVTRDLKRLMMLVLAGVLLVQVFQCQVVDVAWKRFQNIISEKQKDYRTEISEPELIDFIRLWPEFEKLQLANKADISYHVENKTNELNFKTKIWFLYHKWDALRFFYVRQRVECLMNALNIKDQAASIIEDLSSRNDEVAQDMIELQKKRIEAETFSEDEIDLIERYREQLSSIIND